MNCIMRINNLTDKKVSGLLMKMENDDVRADISLKFDPGVYNQLFECLKTKIAKINVNMGQIVSAVCVTDDINPFCAMTMEPMQIFRLIMKSAKVKKCKLYEKYMELTNCSKRTAISHLQRSIQAGQINEIDHYTVEVANGREPGTDIGSNDKGTEKDQWIA